MYQSKNIIIVGPSRSGKSTLARLLNNEFNSFVISIDKLVAVFENAYPDLDIRLNWNRDKTTENIAPFLGNFLGVFSSPDGRSALGYSHGAVEDNNFILEGAYYDFDKIDSIIRSYNIKDPNEQFIRIGLVQCNKTADEFYSDFRRYDTENDWTYHLSDEELRQVAEEAVSYNQEMMKDLTAHGFRVFDTSVDRDAIFSEIIETIRRDKENS
ncbi:MAG: hypothetical protein J6U54_21995 [Clostridiales bacterium]|nr:hypothetical protein [Clostridiales bacterium]